MSAQWWRLCPHCGRLVWQALWLQPCWSLVTVFDAYRDAVFECAACGATWLDTHWMVTP